MLHDSFVLDDCPELQSFQHFLFLNFFLTLVFMRVKKIIIINNNNKCANATIKKIKINNNNNNNNNNSKWVKLSLAVLVVLYKCKIYYVQRLIQ